MDGLLKGVQDEYDRLTIALREAEEERDIALVRRDTSFKLERASVLESEALHREHAATMTEMQVAEDELVSLQRQLADREEKYNKVRTIQREWDSQSVLFFSKFQTVLGGLGPPVPTAQSTPAQLGFASYVDPTIPLPPVHSRSRSRSSSDMTVLVHSGVASPATRHLSRLTKPDNMRRAQSPESDIEYEPLSLPTSPTGEDGNGTQDTAGTTPSDEKDLDSDPLPDVLPAGPMGFPRPCTSQCPVSVEIVEMDQQPLIVQANTEPCNVLESIAGPSSTASSRALAASGPPEPKGDDQDGAPFAIPGDASLTVNDDPMAPVSEGTQRDTTSPQQTPRPSSAALSRERSATPTPHASVVITAVLPESAPMHDVPRRFTSTPTAELGDKPHDLSMSDKEEHGTPTECTQQHPPLLPATAVLADKTTMVNISRSQEESEVMNMGEVATGLLGPLVESAGIEGGAVLFEEIVESIVPDRGMPIPKSVAPAVQDVAILPGLHEPLGSLVTSGGENIQMSEPLPPTLLEDAPHTMQAISLPTTSQQQSPPEGPVAVVIDTPSHEVDLIPDMSQDELPTPAISEPITPTELLQGEGSTLAVNNDVPNHATEPTNVELLLSWPTASSSSISDPAHSVASASGDLLENQAFTDMQREQPTMSGTPTLPESQDLPSKDIEPKPQECLLLDNTQIVKTIWSNSPRDNPTKSETVDRAQTNVAASEPPLPSAHTVRDRQALEEHSPPPEDVDASALATPQALQKPQEDWSNDTAPGLSVPSAVSVMKLSAAISIDHDHGVAVPSTTPSGSIPHSADPTTASVLEQPLIQNTCSMDIDSLLATDPSDNLSTGPKTPADMDVEMPVSTSELQAPAPVDPLAFESNVLPSIPYEQQNQIDTIPEHTEPQVDARPDLPAQKVPRVSRKAFDPVHDAIQTASVYSQAIAVEQTLANLPTRDQPAVTTPVRKDFNEAFPPPLAAPVRRATSPLQTLPPQAQARSGSAPPAAEAFPLPLPPPPPSSEPPIEPPPTTSQADVPKKVVKRKRAEPDADSTNGHLQTVTKRTRQTAASSTPASGSTKPKPAASTSRVLAAKPKPKQPTQSTSNRRMDFRCQEPGCTKKESTKRSMVTHLQTKHDLKYFCPYTICTSGFNEGDDLRAHIDKHLQTKLKVIPP